MTQTMISKKQENKGAAAILALTGMLPQVLKQYGGIYGVILPETDGLTVEDWNDAFDFHRFVGKNGKKGAYTPGTFNAAVRSEMKTVNDEGKVFQNLVFKNVAATYCCDEEDGKEHKYRVFTSKADAEDPEGKPFSKYTLVGIDPHKWSVQTIIKVLRQSKSYVEHNKKAEAANEVWENVEECYIAKWETVKVLDENGKETGKTMKVRKAIRIEKDRVQF